MAPSIVSTFKAYSSTPSVRLLSLPLPSTAYSDHFKWGDLAIPSALLALGVNVVTQGLCIRGVNRLTSVSVLGPPAGIIYDHYRVT